MQNGEVILAHDKPEKEDSKDKLKDALQIIEKDKILLLELKEKSEELLAKVAQMLQESGHEFVIFSFEKAHGQKEFERLCKKYKVKNCGLIPSGAKSYFRILRSKTLSCIAIGWENKAKKPGMKRLWRLVPTKHLSKKDIVFGVAYSVCDIKFFNKLGAKYIVIDFDELDFVLSAIKQELSK